MNARKKIERNREKLHYTDTQQKKLKYNWIINFYVIHMYTHTYINMIIMYIIINIAKYNSTRLEIISHNIKNTNYIIFLSFLFCFFLF
jgi:hypothetical protein